MSDLDEPDNFVCCATVTIPSGKSAQVSTSFDLYDDWSSVRRSFALDCERDGLCHSTEISELFVGDTVLCDDNFKDFLVTDKTVALRATLVTCDRVVEAMFGDALCFLESDNRYRIVDFFTFVSFDAAVVKLFDDACGGMHVNDQEITQICTTRGGWGWRRPGWPYSQPRVWVEPTSDTHLQQLFRATGHVLRICTFARTTREGELSPGVLVQFQILRMESEEEIEQRM